MERTIIHVDMDAFYASVEMRDHPELRGKPLIIGALPSERGVVSTCSYEARVFGVRSAMSIKEAYRRCPQGIYMHPNMEKYREASRQVHTIWGSYTDRVESISLDEGYLDVTGSMALFGSAMAIAEAIKRRTREEVGLSCSVGIGYTMMAAKLASEERKPDGLFAIPDREALRTLILDRSVRVLLGVGQKTAAVLEGAGIRTVRELEAHRTVVVQLLGNHGRQLLELADGIDRRVVTPDAPPKSIGKEHTFQQDLTDRTVLRDKLRLIAGELSYELEEKGLYAATVTLKVTFGDMKQITRSKTGEPVHRADEIYRIALGLFQTVEYRPIRLIGISVGGLGTVQARQLAFGESDRYEQEERVHKAAFQVRKRFGFDALKTAGELRAEQHLRREKEES